MALVWQAIDDKNHLKIRLDQRHQLLF